MKAAIVWFRQDLRLADNPALRAAVASGAPVVPVYIWSPAEEGGWPPGAASRWWLHGSLQQLQHALQERGSTLLLRSGAAAVVLQELATSLGGAAVYWNRRYEPAALRVERELKSVLQTAGIAAHSYKSALLAEPWEIQTQTGTPYRVFTPYWRSFLASTKVDAPLPSPATLQAPARWPASQPLDALALLPRRNWHESLAVHWQPGEAAARAALRGFTTTAQPDYARTRDRPDLPGTSRLSPHLHFGELSPRQVWTAVGKSSERRGIAPADWPRDKFCAEIIWREFAAHVLHHFPTLPDRSHSNEFDRLDWIDDVAQFKAWTRGNTGIAIVDAGMRELWQTGWMHNRVRMITASLLVKNLLHRWQDGAAWFWDTLVDADLASNSLNWQWVAGTGPDASPWFRIFNPLTQAEKFDPSGDYRQRWVPEAQKPGYPPPCVDLAASRARALEAYARLRSTGSTSRE